MPSLFVNDETMKWIEKLARPFVDKEPQDVIRRALGLLEQNHSVSKNKLAEIPKKISSGKALTKAEMRNPLIDLLNELGGKADVQDIRTSLEARLPLSQEDYELVSGQQQRWWNRACWLRQDLIQEGVFKKGSPHGVWEVA